MARTASIPRPGFRCEECGWLTPKWVGRCGQCQAWGTVQELGEAAGPRTQPSRPALAAIPIEQVDVTTATARPTGVAEFDRVLGTGLVPGAVVLVAGEPGVGKSTLLLDVAGRAAASGLRVLYVSAEESAGQVTLRARRIGAQHPGLLLACDCDLGAVLGHVEQADPQLLIVDSIQTISSSQVDGLPGGMSQVREVASALITTAKARSLPTIVVGHVTKDGAVAGPRTLEHLVDVVCQFEGERHSRLRLIRCVKNRYGPTDEIGCFELTEGGIRGVADPSGLFTTPGSGQVPGTCLSVTVEGTRPLAVEVQALVAPSTLAQPRRATSGVDSPRVAMILAVLQRRAGVDLSKHDVYVSTVGGARAAEPAADLAIAIAAASSRADAVPRRSMIAFGEVGLAGEVRAVSSPMRRLTEAARLGFTCAIMPMGTLDGARVPATMRVFEVADVADAIAVALT